MADVEQPEMRAWRSLVRAKAEMGRALHRGLQDRGLSGAQLGILRVLCEVGQQGVKLHELSQQLYVTPGNLTGLVDRLEEAGYLERSAHPDDRRVTLAVLTSAGRECFAQIYPAHVARIKGLMSALSVQEQEVLSDLLARLAAEAGQMP